MKYQKGIILAADNKYLFVLGTQIFNILSVMYSDIDVIYIVTDNITEKERDILCNIPEHMGYSDVEVKIICFTEKDFYSKIHEKNQTIDVSQFNNPDIAWLGRYTFMSFGRFEALRLLSECKTIVYLDFDMLLRKSIKELFEINADISATLGSASIKEGLGFDLEDTDVNTNKKNISTGIIVFNCASISKQLYNSIYEILAYNFVKLSNGKLVDQAVFSLATEMHQASIHYLDNNIYYGDVGWILSNKASIIHAHGKDNRFWNNIKVNLAWPDWDVFYRKWMEYSQIGNLVDTFNTQGECSLPLPGGETYQFLLKLELMALIESFASSWENVLLVPIVSDIKLCIFKIFKIKQGIAGYIEFKIPSKSFFEIIIYDANKKIIKKTKCRNDKKHIEIESTLKDCLIEIL